MENKDLQRYWRKNLKYLFFLLFIWFVASYCCGILFAEELNDIKIGGFKAGFWFAQQGSIYVFIVVIFAYVYLMNKLDKDFDVDEKAELQPEKKRINHQQQKQAVRKVKERETASF